MDFYADSVLSSSSTDPRIGFDLTTMDFYADLCFLRPGELFSV